MDIFSASIQPLFNDAETALALNEKKEHLCAVNWKEFRGSGSGRGLFQGTAQICHSPNVADEWLSFVFGRSKFRLLTKKESALD